MSANFFVFCVCALFLPVTLQAGDYRQISAFEGGKVSGLARSGGKIFSIVHKAGLFVSEDEGESWNPVPNDPTGGIDLKYLSATGTVVILGDHLSVFIYEISTGSWRNVTKDIESESSIPISFNASATTGQLIVMKSGTYIYVSENDGKSWIRHRVIIGPWGVSLDDITLTESGIYAVLGSEIYFSSDRGPTWKKLDSLPVNYVTFKLSKGETGLWAISSKGLYHCPWDKIHLGQGTGGCSEYAIEGLPPNRVPVEGLLDVKGKIWATGAGALAVTGAGSQKFDLVPLPSTENPGRITSMVNTNNGILLGTSGSGVISVADDGHSKFANSGLYGRSIASLAFHDGVLFALVEGLGLQISRDLGKTWKVDPHKAGVGGSKGRFAKLGNGFYLLQPNSLLRYEPSSEGFKQVAVIGSKSPATAAAWHDGRMYIGTQSDGIFLLGENEDSWLQPTVNPNPQFAGFEVRSMVSNGNKLYATVNNRLYELQPDSHIWQTMNVVTGAGSQPMTYVIAKGDTLYVGGTLHILMGTDRASAWQSFHVYEESDRPYVQWLHAQESFVSAGSTSPGVAYSENSGLSWTILPSPGARVTNLVQVGDNHFIAATEGRSLWRYHPRGAPLQIIAKMEPFRKDLRESAFLSQRISEAVPTLYSVLGRRMPNNGVGSIGTGIFIMPEQKKVK